MIRKLVVILLSGAICLVGGASALAMKYNESPMLRVKVAAGELPTVEKRLPEQPKVVTVLEEIGQYGGAMRMLLGAELWQCQREGMLETYPYFSDQVAPNILESWEVSEGGKVYTFHLRKGMRFSDGVPVTTEDVLFKYEDVLMNEKLTPAFPSWGRVDGEPMELEVVDEYTFRVRFVGAYGSFPLVLHGYGQNWNTWIAPKHYLKRFHPRYTPMEELEPLIKKEGFSEGEWWRLYLQHATSGNAGNVQGDLHFPTLCPWVLVEKPSLTMTTWERNPYYCKVDAEGNQLPYIDRIYAETLTAKEREVATMKYISGQANMAREYIGLSEMSLYLENAEEGGYRLLMLPSELGTYVHYVPNYTYPDPVWRKIIGDVRFRRALSLGMNRQEIIETVYFGLGEPVQCVLAPGSRYMDEKYASLDTQYNPAKANQLLDEMGLDKRDKEGYRLRSDGERLTLPIEFQIVNAYNVPTTEMVVRDWQKLGIDATMKVIGGSLHGERLAANQIVMYVWHQCSSTDDGWSTNPYWWVPYMWVNFGQLWQDWYVSTGKTGEEPPAEIKRLFELMEVMAQTTDDSERLKAGREIVRSQAENLWRICTVGNVPWPVLVGKNMRNVPEKDEISLWVTWNLEQAFLEQK